jgi:hypothetical protein
MIRIALDPPCARPLDYARVQNPEGLALDRRVELLARANGFAIDPLVAPDGTIYVADHWGAAVAAISPRGRVSKIAG